MSKIGGRPKGALNVLSGTARENIIAVFTRLGGTSAMAKWARANQSDFYKLYGRLVPTQVEATVDVTHTVATGDTDSLSQKLDKSLSARTGPTVQ